MSLYEYVTSNPLRFFDPEGQEWQVDRSGGVRAEAFAECDDTIVELAKKTPMDERYFRTWLVPIDGKQLPTSATEKLRCRKFTIPNTVVIGLGEMTALSHILTLPTAVKAKTILKRKGFMVVLYDRDSGNWTSSDVTDKSEDLYGLIGFGHGGAGITKKVSWDSLTGHWWITSGDWLHPYNLRKGQFGILALKVCFAKQADLPWMDDVSSNRVSWLGKGFECAGWTWGMIDTAEAAR